MRNKKTQRSRRRTVWKVIANFLKVQLVISVFLLGLAWGTSPVDKAELQEVVFSSDDIYRGTSRKVWFEDENGFYLLTLTRPQTSLNRQTAVDQLIAEDEVILLVGDKSPVLNARHVFDVRSNSEVYFDYDIYAAERRDAVKFVLGIWVFLTVCNLAGHGFAAWTIVGKGRRTSKLSS